MTFHYLIKRVRPTAAALGFTLFVLPLILGACNMTNPAPSTPDANAIGSAVAQTIEAGGAPATITAIYNQFSAYSTAAVATQQALAPTLAAIAAAPPTTAAAGSVSTPGAQTPQPGATSANPSGLPSVSVSADTNCRSGPSTGFPVVSLLKVGASTAVHGKDTTGQWYYVANPSGGSGFCWLWGQFATLQGNAAALEVVQAPPAPTPVASEANVTASFANIHSCNGDVAAILAENTGGETFLSARVIVRDRDTGKTIGQFSGASPFLPDAGACPPGRGTLKPGETAYLVGPLDETPAAGSNGRIIVTFCTEAALAGDCKEARIDFQFP